MGSFFRSTGHPMQYLWLGFNLIATCTYGTSNTYTIVTSDLLYNKLMDGKYLFHSRVSSQIEPVKSLYKQNSTKQIPLYVILNKIALPGA